MAAIIKSIPCHSVEAVNLAINTVLRENKQQFEENLKKLADVLDLDSSRCGGIQLCRKQVSLCVV